MSFPFHPHHLGSLHSLPRRNMADVHEYQFNVTMSCSGCSGAVTRVLSKLEGVQAFDVSLDTQLVTVKATTPYETVLEKIRKTGKEVRDGKVIA